MERKEGPVKAWQVNKEAASICYTQGPSDCREFALCPCYKERCPPGRYHTIVPALKLSRVIEKQITSTLETFILRLLNGCLISGLLENTLSSNPVR